MKKQLNLKISLKHFIANLGNEKKKVYLGIFLAIISVIISVILPTFLSKATDYLVLGINHEDNLYLIHIRNILLISFLLLIGSTIFSYLESLVMCKVSKKVSYQLRKNIITKINKLPLNYFDKIEHGEILSLMTNDIEVIADTLATDLTEIFSSIILFICILFMMLRLNILLSIVIFLIIPFSLGIWFILVSKSQKYFKDYQDYQGHINAHLTESYKNHTIIKLYQMENKSIKNLKKLNNTLTESVWKSNFISSLMHPLMKLFGNISFVLTCIIGGYFCLQGKMSLGNIQAFITYARNFANPLINLGSLTGVMQQLLVASDRIYEFLNAKEEPLELALDDNSVFKGDIEFKNVNFGYNEKIVIKDLNLKIKAGTKIAIVGPTGSGKTTIVKLLMKFYNINSGEILIDDKNIQEINKKTLRDNIGMVLQDPWVFEGTIKDNIAFGKEKANISDIKLACTKANLNHFVNALPKGYNFKINENNDNISAGEKQLLTIARVFLKNPNIIILDEATSNVDTRTEMLITKSLDKLMKNKTCFIIAHRLSTIVNADIIIVIKDGKLIEMGNHEDLLKQKGFYHELYFSQFGD